MARIAKPLAGTKTYNDYLIAMGSLKSGIFIDFYYHFSIFNEKQLFHFKPYGVRFKGFLNFDDDMPRHGTARHGNTGSWSAPPPGDEIPHEDLPSLRSEINCFL